MHRVTTLTAAAMALLLLACSLAACQARVPLPADGSTARQVLDVYLRALVAGDCETAGALGDVAWCGAVTSYAPPKEFRTLNGEISFETTLVISGGDGSLPDGPNLWTYTLGRGPDGRWRIVDEGMG